MNKTRVETRAKRRKIQKDEPDPVEKEAVKLRFDKLMNIEQNPACDDCKQTKSVCLHPVCSICVDCMNTKSSDVSILPCDHVFHLVCVETWFNAATTCPNCKMAVAHFHTLKSDGTIHKKEIEPKPEFSNYDPLQYINDADADDDEDFEYGMPIGFLMMISELAYRELASRSDPQPESEHRRRNRGGQSASATTEGSRPRPGFVVASAFSASPVPRFGTLRPRFVNMIPLDRSNTTTTTTQLPSTQAQPSPPQQ